MEAIDLTTTQQAEAERIEKIVMEAAIPEIKLMAQLMASKKDKDLLGETEFEIRERVHKIGAKAIEAALNERKKGGM